MKGVFVKRPDGALAAVDHDAELLLAGIAVGSGVTLEGRRARSIAFHRKFFALLKLAFDVWDPDPLDRYGPMSVGKEFERFRKDVLILAGHFTSVWSLEGELRLEAKSLAFANMDELEFGQVYASVLNVVWSRVLRAANYASEAEVERVVGELLRFES